MARVSVLGLASVAAFLFVLAGCGDGSPGGAASSAKATGDSGKKRITVALLPKRKGVPYFTSCAEGAQEAAKELGDVELIYDGPTDGSATASADMIDRWVQKKVDVIAVSPNNPDVLTAAMKKARDKGLHVISWDADATPESREFFVNQATAQNIGYALVDTMAKDIGGEGEVAIISATAAAANQNEWMKHMKERLAEKYPKIQLIDTKYPGEDQNEALKMAQGFISDRPNLKGIFGISSMAFPAAAKAVRDAGKSGKIMVTGLSTPNDMKEFVKDGTVKSVILWNTRDLGYLTVYAARALARGELKPGATVFKAGRLGEKQIAGDNILLGDILVFTKENIDKYDF
ncbi:MAG: substrate-binding domain-containing protein [Planctomycetota bacterium]|nr:substrate-binding domain-containing protein [Planctomycetota bacterium]